MSAAEFDKIYPRENRFAEMLAKACSRVVIRQRGFLPAPVHPAVEYVHVYVSERSAAAVKTGGAQ